MDESSIVATPLHAGAVASVRYIKNPLSLARKVIENSPNVILTGKGAKKFAKENDIEIVDTSYFYDETRWKQWNKIKGTK